MGVFNESVGVVDAQYVTLTTDATLTDERVLTGTANRISENRRNSVVRGDLDNGDALKRGRDGWSI